MADERNALEIHFAVSDKVNVLTGKDGVSHMGLSIFGESYNCGRSEGRFDEHITSHGAYVAVKSSYRLDGFYLKLTDSDVIANAFKEFVDGYLSNRFDDNEVETAAKNTSTTIPDVLLSKMWFVKYINGLKDIPAIRNISVTDRRVYDREIRNRYLLLNLMSFDDFNTLRAPGNEAVKCELLKKTNLFLSDMTPLNYTKLWEMDAVQINDFVDLVVKLKGDLSNRMYDTLLLNSSYFDFGEYKMIGGYNCVRAAFFFLIHGLKYAINKLQNLKSEIETIQKLVEALHDGNNVNIPWRSYRRARWHSDEYHKASNGISFVDTPEDNVYWNDFRNEACLTDNNKKKPLNPCERRTMISELREKTDVTDYERQGIEYVSYDKLSNVVRDQCAPYLDLLKMLGMGNGGGKRTRFLTDKTLKNDYPLPGYC